MAADTFLPARRPANEDKRFDAVKRTGLIRSKNTQNFETYARLFRQIADVPVSYTGLLDDVRQYFLAENFTGCIAGASELPREETLCQHALLDTKPYIVPDLRKDPTFRHHPLVTQEPHWVFWAGFPIVTQQGYVLGTICAVDFQPRELSAEVISLLQDVTNNLALFIQMQTAQQDLFAQKFEGLLKTFSDNGLETIRDARAFLNLCLEKPVSKLDHDALIACGVAEAHNGALVLTAKGATLKTGNGLGPSEYKTKTSPLHDSALLESMLEMIGQEEK